MMRVRRLLLTALSTLACAAPAALAQTPPRTTPTPPAVKYGKWFAAGLAVGLTTLGIRSHNAADADYRDLIDYCRQNGPCLIGGDGRYASSVAEARYQRVVSGDRRARTWLIGGQAALVGSAVLFVLELKRDRGPRNIPFSPLIIEAGPLGMRLGFRIPTPR